MTLCSSQLWHVSLPSGPRFFVRGADESIYDVMAGLADSRHGFTARTLEESLRSADTLDVIEILAQLDEG